MVKVLLSVLSEITTVVALLALTVSVEALPDVTVVGLAEIVTVGTGGVVEALAPLPQEVRGTTNAAPITARHNNTHLCSFEVTSLFARCLRSVLPLRDADDPWPIAGFTWDAPHLVQLHST